jgi:phenylpropionate dioxygenase-like ring-hydroxylating dioxygenase large terminal subunit
MPATQLRNAWYVIARSRDLKKAPLARKLNGQALVVFRDAQGNATVLDAVCPHRGANLAHGRVVDGCIECPYHGWRFASSGDCSHVPSNPRGSAVPAGYGTARFAVIEQQGLIWTTLGKPPEPPPTYAFLDDTSLHSFCYEAEVALPFDWWVENALDFTHLPFVHPNTIGDANAAPFEFDIELRPDDAGYIARSVEQTARKHTMLERLLELRMNVTVELDMPGTALFDIDLGRKRRQYVLALATPIDDNTTYVWNFAARNFLRVPFGNQVGWLFLRAVLKEDLRIAAQSLELVSVDRKRLVSVPADALALEYLRLLKRWRDREAHTTHSTLGGRTPT